MTTMLQPETKIGGIYMVGRKIGAGSFGEIYLVVNTETGQECAAKIESVRCKHPQLLYEAKLLRHLQGATGMPQVYYVDTEGECNVMVMELLGPSLEDVFNSFGRRMPLRNVLIVGVQMLQRIEHIHSRNYIHRDVKPDNFLTGRASDKRQKRTTLYVIDFGLAKRFRDSKTLVHIPYRDDKNLTGTARYASTNAHLGIEQSRRDDLESIGYVLIYLAQGALPWQGMKATTKNEKYQRIMEKKLSTPIEVTCKGLPAEFGKYMTYVKGLKFTEDPDYEFLRGLFTEVYASQAYDLKAFFDWTMPAGGSGAISGSSSATGGTLAPIGADVVMATSAIPMTSQSVPGQGTGGANTAGAAGMGFAMGPGLSGAHPSMNQMSIGNSASAVGRGLMMNEGALPVISPVVVNDLIDFGDGRANTKTTVNPNLSALDRKNPADAGRANDRANEVARGNEAARANEAARVNEAARTNPDGLKSVRFEGVAGAERTAKGAQGKNTRLTSPLKGNIGGGANANTSSLIRAGNGGGGGSGSGGLRSLFCFGCARGQAQ